VSGKGLLFFRPEKVVVGEGAFSGVVEEVTFAGVVKHVEVRAGKDLIRADLLNQNAVNLARGDRVFWTVRPEAITVFEK
jgi:paraquat-inducible protein B